MFNVCCGCGQYRDDKRVEVESSVALADRIVEVESAVAICPECGHQQRFKRLPLYVVTGASGSGKTTALMALARHSNEVVCLDSDILWRDEFNKPEEDYATYRNLWLRMAKNIAQAGRPVALFGSATPGQFEQCVERRYIGDIRYLAYVCDDKELEKRLKARPSWRRSAEEDALLRMKQFNNWLKQNAAATGMATIDTTALGVDETAEATLRWFRKE